MQLLRSPEINARSESQVWNPKKGSTNWQAEFLVYFNMPNKVPLLMDFRIRLVLYPTWRSRHKVKYTGRVCQKYDLLQIYLLYRYLGKHRLPVQGCHDTLITVHSYACVMKGFFGMSQFIAHVRHATFKNTSKVAWDKRATNTWKKKIFVLISS